MDVIFSEFLEETAPKFNKHVVEGLPGLYLDRSLEYIDRVFKIAMQHENLTYLRYVRCTPKEEYEEITKLRNNKRLVDISRSDIYLVRFDFSYTDFTGLTKEFSKYIFLPYVHESSILYLKGAKIHITPVLNDKVITPSNNSIFVRLLRYKIKFFRLYHTVIVDGRKEVHNVIWSKMYNNNSVDKLPITTKARSCMLHYILGKMGFREGFNKYLNIVPIAIDETTDLNQYPLSEYVVCKSTGVKPKTYITDNYTPSKLVILIPRSEYNESVKVFIVEFFYIVDHFPDRINLDMLDNVNTWRILLGHILFSGNYGENKLLGDLNEHYNSLDCYVDSIVREKLVDSGYMVDNFYDLTALISIRFNELILSRSNSGLNIFGKSLEVLYYVLYSITSDIFNVSFKLSRPNRKVGITCMNVIEIFNKTLKMRGISSLTSNRVCAEMVSYSGDNMYPKLTSKISEQENSPNGKGSSKRRLSLGVDKHLDPSMLETGSLLFLPKSNPTPICKINPYINIDLKSGVIKPQEEFDKIRSELERMLKMPII